MAGGLTGHASQLMRTSMTQNAVTSPFQPTGLVGEVHRLVAQQWRSARRTFSGHAMMQAVPVAAILAAYALPDRAKRPVVIGVTVL